MFCYLGWYCSRTHFANNMQNETTGGTSTNISGNDFLSCDHVADLSSACKLTDVVGSITNLHDAEEDERHFAEWKKYVEEATNYKKGSSHQDVQLEILVSKKKTCRSDPEVNRINPLILSRSPHRHSHREVATSSSSLNRIICSNQLKK